MAHFAVFAILVIAVAASGAHAGLIPDIIPSLPTTLVPIPVPLPVIPKVIPQSEADAVNRVRQGCAIGKKGVNIRISAFIAANNRDDSLSPACKKCIAEKAQDVRKNVINSIDETGEEIAAEINAASETWLSVWGAIIDDLPTLILGVLGDCKQQLDTAKSDCIAQTAAPSA